MKTEIKRLMNPSDVKMMLESLKQILHEGPDDRFRSQLGRAVDDILAGKMNISELPDYLRPVLRRLAVSYQEAGLSGPLKATMNLMRL